MLSTIACQRLIRSDIWHSLQTRCQKRTKNALEHQHLKKIEEDIQKLKKKMEGIQFAFQERALTLTSDLSLEEQAFQEHAPLSPKFEMS